jgi:hypothetical protein
MHCWRNGAMPECANTEYGPYSDNCASGWSNHIVYGTSSWLKFTESRTGISSKPHAILTSSCFGFLADIFRRQKLLNVSVLSGEFTAFRDSTAEFPGRTDGQTISAYRKLGVLQQPVFDCNTHHSAYSFFFLLFTSSSSFPYASRSLSYLFVIILSYVLSSTTFLSFIFI